jgi:hypothetical protein
MIRASLAGIGRLHCRNRNLLVQILNVYAPEPVSHSSVENVECACLLSLALMFVMTS